MKKYIKYLTTSIVGIVLLCNVVLVHASAIIIDSGAGVIASITDAQAIYGFTYANNVTDATNDIDIAAGGAIDSTGVYLIIGDVSTKQTDATWALGTNAGCLDTGAVGNSDYYIFVIARTDTGVVDYLCSLSSTAPDMTLVPDYNRIRLIGWYKRVAGTIVVFTTYQIEGGGLQFLWNTPTLDVSLTNTLTTARRVDAVKVPLNFAVTALLRVLIEDAALLNVLIMSPDETDTAVSNTAAPGVNIRSYVAGTTAIMELSIRTSVTGTIAARALANTMDSYGVVTYGFLWARR